MATTAAWSSVRQRLGAAMPSLYHFVIWVVVGLLGGSLAGLMVTRERKGFGLARNLAVGLVGALVGGLFFRVLDFLPELDKVAISLRDIVAAVVGSLLVLAALWLGSVSRNRNDHYKSGLRLTNQ
jgi:uncharacterized membrane protein YeaQ/YmgE (transglycosylase-associated protein family)